jgi:hypothetical protein
VLYKPRRSAILLAIAATAVGLLAGCGSSNKKAGTVSASSYVGQLCTSAAAWLHSIQARTGSLETEIASTSAAQGKRLLEAAVTGAVADTQTVVSSMRAAGVPKVNNGQQIATTVVSSFEGVTSRLAGLQPQIAGMPSNPVAFQAAVKRINGAVREAPLRLGLGVAAINSPELDKAASESAICKSVGARSKS